jgi:hypothetical protein
MRPSGTVRMNQYTALCPQAFEYLIPGKLQSAATGSHANMKPKTHTAKTNRAIRIVFKLPDQDVRKCRDKLYTQTSRGKQPCCLQLTSQSERRLCGDEYRCPCCRFWPRADRFASPIQPFSASNPGPAASGKSRPQAPQYGRPLSESLNCLPSRGCCYVTVPTLIRRSSSVLYFVA